MVCDASHSLGGWGGKTIRPTTFSPKWPHGCTYTRIRKMKFVICNKRVLSVPTNFLASMLVHFWRSTLHMMSVSGTLGRLRADPRSLLFLRSSVCTWFGLSLRWISSSHADLHDKTKNRATEVAKRRRSFCSLLFFLLSGDGVVARSKVAQSLCLSPGAQRWQLHPLRWDIGPETHELRFFPDLLDMDGRWRGLSL